MASRPKLSLRRGPNHGLWQVEKSHMVMMDLRFQALTLEDVRGYLQRQANGYHPSAINPALGQLTYRYEFDDHDQVQVVHAYFVSKDGKTKRFARVRRIEDAPSS